MTCLSVLVETGRSRREGLFCPAASQADAPRTRRAGTALDWAHARSRHRRRHPHPDRARGQGLAEGRPRGRPRRRPAARPRRAQPRGRLRRDRRHPDGLRLPAGRAGLQRRPQRRAAGRASTTTCRPRRSTASAPPRCRRCAWPSTRSSPARATSTSPRGRRPSRAPGARAVRAAPAARRLRGRAVQRLHPDGHHRRERGRALQRVAARRRTSGPRPPQNRAVAARESGHFDREIVPVTLPDGTEVSQRRRPARRARRPRSSPRSSRRSSPDGTVTAGNACPLNDGAAAVLVMSREGRGAGPEAAGADRRLLGGRDPPGDHGPRPDPRGPGGARAGRDDDGRHRRRRDQRGLRRAGRPVPRRAGASTPRSSTRSAARSRSATRSG